jgi:hypothetical protein
MPIKSIEVEFWNSEKSARILRSSGIWRFYIPLPSKCSKLACKVNWLFPAQHCGQKMSFHFVCRFGALISRIFRIWKKFHITECSRHGFTYIRGWMKMVLAPNDLFSWNSYTMSTMLTRVFTLHLLLVMHVDTYSVHNRLPKPWWGRLLCFYPSRHVFSPTLSRLNWRSLTPTGGPGPPTPKVASLPTGSAHTPFSGSGTLRSLGIWHFFGFTIF